MNRLHSHEFVLLVFVFARRLGLTIFLDLHFETNTSPVQGYQLLQNKRCSERNPLPAIHCFPHLFCLLATLQALVNEFDRLCASSAGFEALVRFLGAGCA